jgi:16S rRNA (guanine527-N7)-methyltransferase
MNLVGSIDPGALQRHVSDSLAAAPLLPRGARAVDLGSGAGFPGIPLGIVRPDLDLTLVEIRERRVNFLRHVVRVLGLSCRVERRRIEEPPAEPFDYALLRAVAEPVLARAMAVPWVSASGEIWIWAGSGVRTDRVFLEPPVPLASGGSILRFSRA